MEQIIKCKSLEAVFKDDRLILDGLYETQKLVF